MGFLANAISVARRKRGWTQSELAERLAVTQSAVSFWENGVELPSLEHQVRLVELMPEMLNALASQELAMLDRIQALERQVFNGKCGCAGCSCTDETEVTPISSVARKRDD